MTRNTTFTFIALISFLTAFAQEADDYEKRKKAENYSNYIVQQQSMMTKRLVDYIVSSVHNDNFEEVEDKRQGVLFQIDLAIHNLEKLEPLEEDDEMRKKALDVFKLYKSVYQEDYEEINQLNQTKENSFKNMELYFQALDKTEAKLSKTFDGLNQAQLEFAKKHKFKIGESEGDKTMEIITDVNKYVRDVFLEYFKVSKLNGACLDALAEQDAEKLEKSRLLLLAGAEEAHSSLNNVIAYKGDEDYKSKAMSYITYNKLFASKNLVKLVGILEKKDRTNEDVETFNQIITQYNQDATDLLNQFNNANIKLMRTHIPKSRVPVGEKG